MSRLTPLSSNAASSRRRTSVSSECHSGNLASDATFVPVFHPKSDETLTRIDKIRGNLLFSELDDNQWTVVKNAMFPVDFPAGGMIIKQGDEGDNFYIIETGECDVYVNQQARRGPRTDDLGNLVVSLGVDGSFGELALMYNQPRAATVKARSQVRLWAVDRQTFRNIVMYSTNAKRNMYKSTLRKVKILEKLTEYERDRIADAVKPAVFENGHVIIREGDEEKVNEFFMIEEGNVVVTKAGQEVMRLSTGDYFGEIALMTDRPRQATITADGVVRTVTLDRECFQRLFGPLREFLGTQMSMYSM